MRRPFIRQLKRGFTLIEMLLATGLVAFIMLMAWSGLDASIKLSESGEARIDASSRARISVEFLRRQLTRMLPLNLAKPGEVQRSFEGDSDKVLWIGPMPGYLGRGGAYVQSLEFARVGRSGVLNYRYAMLNGYEEGDIDEIEPIALIEELDEVTFSFRTVDNTGTVTDYKSSWERNNSQQLPLVVKIEFTPSEKSQMQLPTLEAPTLVDANVIRPTARFSNAGPGLR